jgi:PIN domain nuclease of toxin-antitoxin system
VSAATIWEVAIKARDEGLTLVTGDPRCQKYEVAVLPV